MNRRERRRQAKAAKGAGKGEKAAGHGLRGEQLAAKGKIDEAIEAFRQAVSTDPQNAAAHHNLGVLLSRQGLLSEAIESYGRATVLQPDYVDAHYNLGNALLNFGNLDEAAASYLKALALKPDFADAHNNLGNTLVKLGKLDEAAASFHKTLALKPDFADAHNNLGNTLLKLGKLDEAADSYQKLLVLAPDLAEAHYNLGIVLGELGRPDEAIESYQKALTLKPDYTEALNDLGLALQQLGKLDDAAASYHKALAIQPDFAQAHNNLGNALQKLEKLDEAVTRYHKALAIDLDFADAHYNLGNALQKLGQLEEAIASYRRAVAVKPDFDYAWVNLLHQLWHACAWSDVGELETKVAEFTERSIREGGKVALGPFGNITSSADASGNYAVARSRSAEIAKNMSALKPDFQMSGRKSPKPKITIGYLSSDFQNHATAHLMLSLFGLHDRKDFSVFTFSHGQNNGSAYREKIKNDSDKFFDLQAAGHLEAAGQIFESGVDILVDLNGHTRNNRLEICALRPAPVQVNYLGFPGTTGADFLDYVITDRIVTPEDQSPYYSEQLVYLPHCYQVNDHKQKISDVPFTRSDFGLPEKGFAFCSFNRNYKIEPVMFGVWMNLMKKVQDSVLWLFKNNDLAERNLKSEAQARGVDGDRLIFAETIPKDQHLARCRLADLALDTRICGGHTTTSDCLWAGVPVVTMLGSHFASRVSASLLNAVGLPELITHNLEDYEALTFRLSRNPDELDGLTAKLARNRLSEPLFDTPRFVGNLENAYRRMWDNYLSGEQPSKIDVTEG